MQIDAARSKEQVLHKNSSPKSLGPPRTPDTFARTSYIGIRSLTQPGCDVSKSNTITTSLSERMGSPDQSTVSRCIGNQVHRRGQGPTDDRHSRCEIADLCTSQEWVLLK